MDHGEVLETGPMGHGVPSLWTLPALCGKLDFKQVPTRQEGWTGNRIKKETYGREEPETGKPTPVYNFISTQMRGAAVLHHAVQADGHLDG